MSTVDLLGHDYWAQLPDRKGTPLVLLHGGMSSSGSMLGSIGPRLARWFPLAAFDRGGHGRTALFTDEFHYDDMADETIAFLEHLITPAYLVGHSDGGVVALKVAQRRPDLVSRMVVVGANFHHEGLMEMPELREDSEEFVAWAAQYGALSPDGIANAAKVFRMSLRLFRTEPTMTVEDLATITTPTLVLAGDDDVATLAHTAALYESLAQAQLAIVPGASHSVLKERTKDCVRLIRRFLHERDAPLTVAPLRRRLASPGDAGVGN